MSMNATKEQKAMALVGRLLDPEDLGYTANREIRDAARRVLGYAPVETVHRNSQIPPRRNPPPRVPQPAPESRITPASQTRLHSLIESLANVAVGYGVALASQLLIFPMYGIKISLSTNIAIGLWFTAISIARSYAIRRWFNGFKVAA